MAELKKCIKCDTEKSATEEFFQLIKRTGKLNNQCRDCMREYHRDRNKKKNESEGKVVKKVDPEPFRGVKKTCIECKEEKDISEFQKRSDSADGHNNKCRECKSGYHKTWKTEIATGERELFVAPEIVDGAKKCLNCLIVKPISEFGERNDIAHGYRYDCKDCRRLEHNEWQKKRLETDDSFKIRRESCGNLKSFCSHPLAKSKKVESLTDIDNVLLRSWYESFDFGGEAMWDKYASKGGDEGWSTDHVIPVSFFDLTKPEEKKLAYNWKNTRPLGLAENYDKRNKFVPGEYEKQVVKVKEFIRDRGLPETEYQGLAEMSDWLRNNLRYGDNLTDEDPTGSEMDDPQPSS